MTSGQRRALAEYWPRYGLEFTPEVLDLDRVFGRTAIRVLDIGAGMGETTLALANTREEADFLAVDVHLPGIGSLLRGAADSGLRNIRVIRHDIVEVVRFQLPVASMDEIYLFFPDPWHKKRHHKRRLLNHAFAGELASRLKRNGRLFIATDWRELAISMLEVCDTEPTLENLAGRGNFSPRPMWRPLTRFERRGQRLAHGTWDLIYAPVPSTTRSLRKD